MLPVYPPANTFAPPTYPPYSQDTDIIHVPSVIHTNKINERIYVFTNETRNMTVYPYRVCNIRSYNNIKNTPYTAVNIVFRYDGICKMSLGSLQDIILIKDTIEPSIIYDNTNFYNLNIVQFNLTFDEKVKISNVPSIQCTQCKTVAYYFDDPSNTMMMFVNVTPSHEVVSIMIPNNIVYDLAGNSNTNKTVYLMNIPDDKSVDVSSVNTVIKAATWFMLATGFIMSTTATTAATSIASISATTTLSISHSSQAIISFSIVSMLQSLQVTFSYSFLAMGQIPPNFKEYVQSLNWAVLDINLPWKSECSMNHFAYPSGIFSRLNYTTIDQISYLLDDVSSLAILTHDTDVWCKLYRTMFWTAVVITPLFVIQMLYVNLPIFKKYPSIKNILKSSFSFPALQHIVAMFFTLMYTSLAGEFFRHHSAKHTCVGLVLLLSFPVPFLVYMFHKVIKHIFYKKTVTVIKGNKHYKWINVDHNTNTLLKYGLFFEEVKGPYPSSHAIVLKAIFQSLFIPVIQLKYMVLCLVITSVREDSSYGQLVTINLLAILHLMYLCIQPYIRIRSLIKDIICVLCETSTYTLSFVSLIVNDIYDGDNKNEDMNKKATFDLNMGKAMYICQIINIFVFASLGIINILESFIEFVIKRIKKKAARTQDAESPKPQIKIHL